MMRIFLILAVISSFIDMPVAFGQADSNKQNTSDPFVPAAEDPFAEEEIPPPPSEKQVPPIPTPAEPTLAPIPGPADPEQNQTPAPKKAPLPTPPQNYQHPNDADSQNNYDTHRAGVETPPALPPQQQQQEAINEYSQPVDCGHLSQEDCDELIRQRLRAETQQSPVQGDHIMQAPSQQPYYDQQTYNGQQANDANGQNFQRPGAFDFPFPPPQNAFEQSIQDDMRMNMARIQAQIANGFPVQQVTYSSTYCPPPQFICTPALIITGDLATSLHQMITSFPVGPTYYPHVYRGQQIEFYGQASQNVRDLLALHYQNYLDVFPSLFQPSGLNFSVTLVPYAGEDIAARDQAILQNLQIQLSNMQ